jgi:hypothetical protein
MARAILLATLILALPLVGASLASADVDASVPVCDGDGHCKCQHVHVSEPVKVADPTRCNFSG